MKRKLKHSSAQRLYWKKAQRRWRSKHPRRTKEIQREYWRRKRLRMKSGQRKARKVHLNDQKEIEGLRKKIGANEKAGES